MFTNRSFDGCGLGRPPGHNVICTPQEVVTVSSLRSHRMCGPFAAAVEG